MDIPLPELSRFFSQVSIAAFGAASLWGLVLVAVPSWRDPLPREKRERIARILFRLSAVFLLLYLLFWSAGAFLFFAPEAVSHEGIRIIPSEQEIVNGFRVTFPMVALLALLGAFGLFAHLRRKEFFRRFASVFFFLQFALASAILALAVSDGEWGSRQLFFSLHSWHSVLTLGSVIAVDILYFATLRLHDLKAAIYAFFPLVSIFVWVGLGIDFLSVILIAEEAFVVTSQMLFSQTVVGIIILNGAFLASKANDALIRGTSPDGATALDRPTELLFGIAGSVSIASWTTITFVDFFTFAVGYGTLLVAYALVVVAAYLAHFALERLVQR